MKIENIEVRTIIVVNGEEFTRKVQNWTQSVSDAQDAGVSFNTNRDVVDWIEFQQ